MQPAPMVSETCFFGLWAKELDGRIFEQNRNVFYDAVMPVFAKINTFSFVFVAWDDLTVLFYFFERERPVGGLGREGSGAERRGVCIFLLVGWG